MNARTNERTHDGRHGFVCFFLYFLLFVWFCFVISSATINVPTVQNAINPWRADHRRMTEGMNEWPKEGTNEQMNIEAWLEHNRKICRQFGPTPKNTFLSEFCGPGERFGEGFDGSGHKFPADSYWNLLGRSIANFRNYLKTWFIFLWKSIETWLKDNLKIYLQFWATADAKKIASLDALERDFKRVKLISSEGWEGRQGS